MEFGDDVLIRLRQGADWRGDPVGEPDESALHGWYVQPAGPAAEDTDRRDQVDYEYLAFGPPDADVLATDRVRWGGQVHEVLGEPDRWAAPGQPPHHTELKLKRVEG